MSLDVIQIVNNALAAKVAAAVTTATAPLAAENTALKSTVAARNATIATLEAEIAAQRAEIERLRNAPTPTDPTPPVDEEPEPETPIPTPDAKSGIFYSVEELRARPRTGTPYQGVVKMSTGSLNEPDLSDLDAQGDAQANAMAMHYAVTGDDAIKTKLIAHLRKLPNTDWDRTLEASRGLAGYVAAVDILKQIDPTFDDKFFRDFLIMALQKDLPGHSNFRSILASAFNQLNNWSAMARSTVISASLYLMRYGDAAQKAMAQPWLDKAAKVHRVFLGDLPESALGYKLDIDQTTWYPEWPPKDVVGVLKRGTIIKGFWLDTNEPMDIHGSGITPLEALRTQGTSASARIGKPAYYPMPNLDRGYLWEIWNGTIPAAVALHRAGIVAFNAGDYAIQRSMEFLYGRGEAALNKGADGKTWTYPASGDDLWVPYFVNHYGKPAVKFPELPEGSPGKAGIGHGAWLFGGTS
jgi:hypothetical protein